MGVNAVITVVYLYYQLLSAAKYALIHSCERRFAAPRVCKTCNKLVNRKEKIMSIRREWQCIHIAAECSIEPRSARLILAWEEIESDNNRSRGLRSNPAILWRLGDSIEVLIYCRLATGSPALHTALTTSLYVTLHLILETDYLLSRVIRCTVNIYRELISRCFAALYRLHNLFDRLVSLIMLNCGLQILA